MRYALKSERNCLYRVNGHELNSTPHLHDAELFYTTGGALTALSVDAADTGDWAGPDIVGVVEEETELSYEAVPLEGTVNLDGLKFAFRDGNGADYVEFRDSGTNYSYVGLERATLFPTLASAMQRYSLVKEEYPTAMPFVIPVGVRVGTHRTLREVPL